MEEYMFKKATMFFIFIGFVTFLCVAQSTNNEPRLVGTWTDLSGKIWVFNKDGTGLRDGAPFKFGTIEEKMVFTSSANSGFGYELAFSRDGKNLILYSQSNSVSYFLQKRT
jgi:hypothetical protein